MLTIEVSPKLNIYTVTAVTGVCGPSETIKQPVFSSPDRIWQKISPERTIHMHRAQNSAYAKTQPGSQRREIEIDKVRVPPENRSFTFL